MTPYSRCLSENYDKARTFLTPLSRCPIGKTTAQELLAQVEKIYAQRNVRPTPQHLEVLCLVSLQDGTISAYDLLDLLREAEPQAKPPTVCRALGFLLEQGFIYKVESTNSCVFCHLLDQPTRTSTMFICDRYDVVKEECTEGVEDIMHTLAVKMGFALRHNVIEAYGLCSACIEVETCRYPKQCHCDHSIQMKKKPRQKGVHPYTCRAGGINYQR